jgi:hypothetical protein
MGLGTVECDIVTGNRMRREEAVGHDKEGGWGLGTGGLDFGSLLAVVAKLSA